MSIITIIEKVLNQVGIYTKIRDHFSKDYREYLTQNITAEKIDIWKNIQKISNVYLAEIDDIVMHLGNLFVEAGISVYISEETLIHTDKVLTNYNFITFDSEKLLLIENLVIIFRNERTHNIKGSRAITINDLFKEFNRTYLSEKLRIAFENVELAGAKTLLVYVPLKGFPKNSFRYENVSFSDFSKMENDYSWEEFCKIRKDVIGKSAVISIGGLRQYADYASETVNFFGGMRSNPFISERAKNHIYIIGPCIVAGLFTKDEDTIGSKLQLKTGDKYNVISYGCGEISHKYHINRIESLKVMDNDIVIYITETHMLGNFSNVLDMSASFGERLKSCKPFYYEVPVHCNSLGYEIIANEIEAVIPNLKSNPNRVLADNMVLKSSGVTYRNISVEAEMEKYVSFRKKILPNSVVGCIVMNCNPITNGHVYLIEKALLMVDFLYIFVVEEDKSFFSFEDRFDLVKTVCRKYGNVAVVPSGTLIISKDTFGAYFTKESNNDQEIDVTKDITYFCEYVVPLFNINVRFLGEEPFDKVTAKYNTALKQYLPMKGIEVKIFKRLENNGSVVSATHVRKLINSKDFDDIRNLVPIETYKYIIERFG